MSETVVAIPNLKSLTAIAKSLKLPDGTPAIYEVREAYPKDPKHLGCFWFDYRRIDVMPFHDPAATAFVVLHEIGHAVLHYNEDLLSPRFKGTDGSPQYLELEVEAEFVALFVFFELGWEVPKGISFDILARATRPMCNRAAGKAYPVAAQLVARITGETQQ